MWNLQVRKSIKQTLHIWALGTTVRVFWICTLSIDSFARLLANRRGKEEFANTCYCNFGEKHNGFRIEDEESKDDHFSQVTKNKTRSNHEIDPSESLDCTSVKTSETSSVDSHDDIDYDIEEALDFLARENSLPDTNNNKCHETESIIRSFTEEHTRLKTANDPGSKNKIKSRLEDFNFITMIGNGSFGSVYLAEHARDGRVFAVKVVEKARVLERGTAHNLLAERRSLEVCAGAAFITQLHSSFQVAAECSVRCRW